MKDIKNILSNRHYYMVVSLDAVLVVAAYLAAYFLRFEGSIPDEHWQHVRDTLPFIVPLKIACFFFFGLYRGMWRYTSLLDLISVIRASIVSSTAIVLIILFTSHFQGFSRSVFLIDFVLTVALIGGVRVAIRMALAEHQPYFPFFKRALDARAKKAVIIGAGDAAEAVLRE
ncbi:MAG: polysaccharide biosynthesis protein, partial [Deltaproteobacteria bacterium]|nr:polysaccharide biosynthesis protein [Deltaproteobacteria bacterium]